MKSLSVKNYKNLRDFKIESLSKVNLIVGKNNAGKSTLLEAISIFTVDGRQREIESILKKRGLSMDSIGSIPTVAENKYTREAFQNFSTLFSDRNTDMPIEITADSDQTLTIRVVDAIQEQVINADDEIVLRNRIVKDSIPDNYIYDILKGYEVLKNKELSYSYIFEGIAKISVYRKRKTLFQFVDTSANSNNDNPDLYSTISMTDREEYLLEALRIIEPRIEAINFLKDDWLNDHETHLVPYVVFKDEVEKRRLSVMGDGINRILTIALAMLNCEDATLLIDEFDNGLHYSVQTKLWEAVYFLANKLNIQVFATTHSDDCVKSFIEADENGDGKLIRLENRGEVITAVEFNDKKRLMFAINNDVEVR